MASEEVEIIEIFVLIASTHTVSILSVEAEDNVFKYYQYAGITTEAQLMEYVAGVKKLSEYDTGVEVAYGDQLITLSTCSYHVGDGKGRFAVVAKKIK